MEDLPKINCHRQQITQVIVNLIMNARDALNAKFSGYDEEKLIEIKSYRIEREDQCWLRTEILDHGIGIDEDTSGSIFDPFFTTKPRTDRSGMGLSVCFGIIKEHGGEIFMETEPGQYTRVYFDLPCLK
jgi:signal transduction histidine kinase